MNDANPKLPDKSRVYAKDFVLSEALAHYTSDAYLPINRFLREGGQLEPVDAAIHAVLQQAFSQLDPFDEPIKVHRAVNMQQVQIKSFVQVLLDAWKEDKMVELAGYQSCTTDKKALSLVTSPIKLIIKAIIGIDVRPVSVSPNENELLLNHGSSFDIKNIRWPPESRQIVVKLEQIQ